MELMVIFMLCKVSGVSYWSPTVAVVSGLLGGLVVGCMGVLLKVGAKFTGDFLQGVPCQRIAYRGTVIGILIDGRGHLVGR